MVLITYVEIEHMTRAVQKLGGWGVEVYCYKVPKIRKVVSYYLKANCDVKSIQ